MALPGGSVGLPGGSVALQGGSVVEAAADGKVVSCTAAMLWKQLAMLLASGCRYFWLTASVCSKSESASSSSPALNFSSPSEKKEDATRSASRVRTRSPSCAWKFVMAL